MIMEPLTADERLTLKTGAFGAVFLVSNAEPGMLAMVRESFAASGALGEASGVVKDALTTGPLPELRRESALEIEATVLPALSRSVAILREKSPEDVEAYRSVVLSAADRVAQAHHSVTPAEASVLDRIRAALAEPA
ncbi:hypothetical protein GA0074695_5697 [Micromonospora viridifaciens]|uniref:Uncharacterized protein n=1 Tax=Micromonospora viridifaciens TaxID=1881 RepID=A0A1C4ZK25_MICVI|nr:hypothetical protein [Micromonospora viridifaciens]SCF33144.1 hypothetical protein GA0074695_5697 [Micromonospora viridifaciens]